MNIALIFAGGTGQRMNTKTKPKQFLELHGKPIIIHTIEQFENHPHIDGVVVVCLESWISALRKMLKKNGIEKVASIVPGGKTGQASIRNGIREAAALFPEDSVILIHDSVRPLIDDETISSCIECVREHGSAITVIPAVETVIRGNGHTISEVVDRSTCFMARAPQCFILKDILEAHERALAEERDDFIDSASMMRHYGHSLHMVTGSSENIKITTPLDFYIFRAIADARENSQIFGL